MDPKHYRYKGHRFSITSDPVSDGEGCTFFADIDWVERDEEQFTRYRCDRTFMTPQEARMEGIAIVRNWIDEDKPGINTILQKALFGSERVFHQLRSAFEQSYKTMDRSRVLHAEMERVLEQSRLALLASNSTNRIRPSSCSVGDSSRRILS
jgi:hypothetical protein